MTDKLKETATIDANAAQQQRALGICDFDTTYQATLDQGVLTPDECDRARLRCDDEPGFEPISNPEQLDSEPLLDSRGPWSALRCDRETGHAIVVGVGACACGQRQTPHHADCDCGLCPF